MKNTTFGIEIEFTGITRSEAAAVVAAAVNGYLMHIGGTYDTYSIQDAQIRDWKIVYDGSIRCESAADGAVVGTERSCELVSPPLTYAEDMALLQQVVRDLRKAGARVNSSCGIHVHLDGSNQTVRSIKNWVNIIASRGDLFYKALGVLSTRIDYCQKLDTSLVEACKPCKTMTQLEDAWYKTYTDTRGRTRHYHNSRYHFLNLHSFFSADHHTVELRGFNSTLHAGQIRSYVVLALALNQQALTQKTARAAKPQTDNEKFAMRTYLCRLGLSGEEFAACREHLTKNLSGCAAWRFGASH